MNPNQDITISINYENDFKSFDDHYNESYYATLLIRAMEENSGGFWKALGKFEHSFNQLKGTTYRSDWESYDDMGNSGGVTTEQGKALIGGTLGVITAPFTIVLGGGWAILGYAGLVNSVDDLGTNSDGNSFLQQVSSNETYQSVISWSKTGVTVLSLAGGVYSIATSSLKNFQVPAVISVANDGQSLWFNFTKENEK